MDQLRTLREYLLVSIKKHGNQPLTVEHLANLIGVLLKEHDAAEESQQKSLEEAENWLHRDGNQE